MASSHEIEIIIAPDGSIKLDVKGMKGAACVPVIGQVAKAVGGEVQEAHNKPEFYQQQAQQQQKKIGG